MKRPTPRSRSLRLLLALLVGAVLLSGCDLNIYSLPLPGGAKLGSNPITVTADFRNVLDLVPKSAVKVNDVTVGEITDIKLDDQTAVVTMKLRDGLGLPSDTYAKIRQTSLLGEKFVSLEPPPGGGTGALATGDTIPLARTDRNPEVEEVLGALSLVLNGGGVAQLKTIAEEINTTLGGREDAARDVLTQIATFTGQLDDHKTDIVHAIESLNRLALSVKAQQGSIDAALEQLPSALDSLDRQRTDLVKMLQALDRLSGVGVRVIQRSKEATFESLRQLQPVLTQLANSGSAFVNSINVSLTYPFVDEVVGRDPQVARNLQQGDYTNLSIQLNLDFSGASATCDTLSQLPTLPTGLPDLSNACPGVAAAITKCQKHPSVKNCQGIPAAIIKAICTALPSPLTGLCGGSGGGGGGGGGLPPLPPIPGVPGLPGLPGGGTHSGQHAGGGGGGGGNGGALGGLGGGLAGGLGSPRAPFGVARAHRHLGNGPTMGQLEQVYDPALVSLLIPGMVLQ